MFTLRDLSGLADCSIFQLMAPTYALAETGAAIILAAYSPNATTSTTGTTSATSTSSGASTSTTTKTNAALGYAEVSWIGLLIPILAGLLL